MSDPSASTNPLRGFDGAVPAAPLWFSAALAAPYESFSVEVAGATIDCRAWGDRAKPGLVFLHGNAAHLGWWSFLAPFFAADHRVVALSLSGMGGSDWRDTYSVDLFASEALAAAEAGGAAIAGPPVFVGHSMGGLPVIRIAAQLSDRMRAAITVDTGLPGPEMFALFDRIDPHGHAGRPPLPVYPDLAVALDRFRLSPPQPCENTYIADYLARMGLKPVQDGWTWRFDRGLWGGVEHGDIWDDLAIVKAPLAMIRGDLSQLTAGAQAERLRRTAPDRTIFIDLPAAHHHVMIDQPIALVAALRTLLAAWP